MPTTQYGAAFLIIGCNGQTACASHVRQLIASVNLRLRP